MLEILWKRGEIAPEEQFLLLFTIFCYLMLDFNVKTRIRFCLRDSRKRLVEITEFKITRVDCITYFIYIIINSCFLKLLISQSKFSGNRKFTMRYQQFGMNFKFEISRVERISNRAPRL